MWLTVNAINDVTDGVSDHVVVITSELLNDVSYVIDDVSITLLHLRPNVITFRTLLLSESVITFRYSTGRYHSSSGLLGQIPNLQKYTCCKTMSGSYI